MSEDDHANNDGNDDTTASTSTRWTYTATVLAIATVLSLPGVIIGAATGHLTLENISQGWFILYLTVVLMAATWVFGEKALKAVQEYRGQ